MNKKKPIYILSILFISCLLLGGCTTNKEETATEPTTQPASHSAIQAPEATSTPKKALPLDLFIGAWHCKDYPKDCKKPYTGYMNLDIMPDGMFSIYDVNTEKPCISGTMTVDTENELTLQCTPSAEFNPPASWEKMSHEQTITYKFASNTKLLLTYTKGSSSKTLVFIREQQE